MAYPPIPKPKRDDAQIVLRKAITEALEGVLLRIPELVAKAVSKEHSRVVMDSQDTAKRVVKALEELELPAPQVNVEAPTVVLDTKPLEKGQEAVEKAVLEAVEAFQKQQTLEDALVTLIERMRDDKKLWLNVRMTDGKKFLDKFSESLVVGVNTSALAKENTLQDIKTALSTKVTTSGLSEQPVRVNLPFTPKITQFGLSATGTIVSAVPGKRIKVYHINLGASAATGFMFRDGGAGQPVPGLLPFAANGGEAPTVNPPAFLFATTAGNSLDAVITASGVAGWIAYWDDDTT